MTITAEKIISQFGAYYINEGQNESRLLKLIKQKTVTPTHARSIITENTLYRFANTHFGEVIQAFQKEFTPKGSAEFKPNEVQLRNIKFDLAIWPDEIVESWLGFLSDLDTDDRANWPIVRYIMEEYAKPQVDHDLETKVYGKGEYEAPMQGHAGAAINACDGIITLVNKGLVNVQSPMNPVILSDEVSPATAFDLFEEFVDNIDGLYLDNLNIKLFVDPKLEKWYWRDKRNTHGTDSNYNDQKAKVIDFMSNVEIVALPSLSGTGAIIATPEGNFVHIRRKNGYNRPSVGKKDLRQVQIGLDWWEALGFGYNELVWAYLPEVTVEPEPATIIVMGETDTVSQGDETVQFSAIVKPDGASQAVEWSIDPDTGIEIDENGLVTIDGSTPDTTYTVKATSKAKNDVDGTFSLEVTS